MMSMTSFKSFLGPQSPPSSPFLCTSTTFPSVSNPNTCRQHVMVSTPSFSKFDTHFEYPEGLCSRTEQ